MADINSALHNLQYLQQDAQGALPVIPNNGNPAGAYNMASPVMAGPGLPAPMPAVPQQQPQPGIPMPKPSPADRYPWLRPTQSMDNVRNLLAQRRQQLPAVPNRGNLP